MQLEKLTQADWESVLGTFGIVGAGGGYKGALSLGFMTEFDRLILSKGIWPPIMWATSVDTLIFAAIIASGSSFSTVRTFLDLERAGPDALFNKWEAALNALANCFTTRNALYGDRGLRRLIDGIDFRSLINAPTELRFSVYREIARRGFEYRVISSHGAWSEEDELNLRKFARASASPAGIFAPVIIRGHTYSDGLRPPLMEAVKSHLQTIFLLINDMYLPENHAKAGWLKRIGYSSDAHYHELLLGQLSCAIEGHGYRIINAASSLPLVSSARKIELEKRAEEERGSCDLRPDRVIVISAARNFIPHLTTKSFSKSAHSIYAAITHGKECMHGALEALVRFRCPDLI